MFNKLTNYLKETRSELKHVNWPTKNQTVNFTLLVIAVTVITAVFLGVFDVLFGFLLGKLMFF